jgi:hypothetical protein
MSASFHVRKSAIARNVCVWLRLNFSEPRNAAHREPTLMHGLIYLIGLIVVIMAILSFLGLR